MGLFQRHDYGRDYRADPRAGAMRGRWGGGAARQQRYDAELRERGRGYDARDFAYRGLDGAWSTAWNRGAHDPEWDWRQAAQHRRAPYAPGAGYDGGYRGSGMRGYAGDYSARQAGYGGRPRGPEPRHGDVYWPWRHEAGRGYDRGYGPRPRGGQHGW